MLQNALAAGAPSQTPLGSLRRSPRPPNRKGLRAFGARNSPPKANSPPKNSSLDPPLPPGGKDIDCARWLGGDRSPCSLLSLLVRILHPFASFLFLRNPFSS